MNLRKEIVLLKSDCYISLACCLVFLCICWGNGREAQAASRLVKYLHVEANEGDSSGGHTAIRFDGETFHFQHESNGLIRIKRLDSATFDHSYAMLGNRTIGESWIAVSEETYALLLDGFSQLLFIQDEQLNILDDLSRDVATFEFLLQKQDREGGRGGLSLSFTGLGYFPKGGSDVSSPSPALLRLKEQVRKVYGERFIEQRLALAAAAIRNLKLQATAAPPKISRDSYPAPVPVASTVYHDDLLALFALETLQAAPRLMPGSFRPSPGSTFLLAPEEKQTLELFAQRLEGDLLRLVNSSRSDWGFAFIVGMARLAAVEASISSGSLVLLDTFPDPPQGGAEQKLSGERYLPAMKDEVEELFRKRRSEFFSDKSLREADYAAIELLGNRLLEIEQAIVSRTPLRIPAQMPVPSRKGWRAVAVFPDMDEALLAKELATARSAEKGYRATLANLYAYDLFHRNCVTEIFAAINNTFERQSLVRLPAAQAGGKDLGQISREESQQRLGGFVDAAKGLAFVPVFSAGEVNACYAVVARHERPSYRLGQLALMKKRESSLLVFLRESNTITSTIYTPAEKDSAFLFFTDDTFLLRPLFGAVNLLVGLGDSLLGLLTLPLEGPQRLHSGAKGVLFSLPELVFVNLRKGSLEYVR